MQVYALSDLRQVTDLVEDEPRHGLKVSVFLQLDRKKVRELVDWHPARDEEGAIGSRHHLGLVSVVFGEFAGYRFQHVHGRDDAFEVAVLVEDQDHVRRRGPQPINHLKRILTVANNRSIA